MSNRRGVLAGGNFLVDTIKTVDRWPEPSGLALISSCERSNGGGPYNVLKNLAVLDNTLPLEACGRLGDDDNGRWILQDCQRAGIDTRRLHQHPDAATGYADVIETPDKQRTFFSHTGANSNLSANDFRLESSRAKILYVGYLMTLDRMDARDAHGNTETSQLLTAARELGFITAVDCVSSSEPHFANVARPALATTDIFFCNDFEAGRILSRPVASDDDVIAAAVALRDQANHATVVVHSARIAASATPANTLFTLPAKQIPTAEFRGTNGAGDAFAAGYLLAVHSDKTEQKRLEYATEAAAMSLRHSTASGGLSRLDIPLSSDTSPARKTTHH